MKTAGRVIAALVVVATAVSGAGAFFLASAGSMSDALESGDSAPITLSPLAQRGVMLAADGSVIATMYAEDRVEVQLDEVPQVVRDAVIAVEDARFFDHIGVSVPGVARAARQNATKGEVSQGGSTITQQLVKNELLTDERTISRKAKEAALALKMEQEFSKSEILERYLNTVYFGEGAHGVYTAAQRYFGKELSDVSLAEAALIAGQIASPGAYSPFENPDAAEQRRATVLERMVAEGVITREEQRVADREPLPTTLHRRAAQPNDYFAEEVRRQLLNDSRLGATPEARRRTVFRGGIRVETTLDPRLQALAEQSVAQHLPESPFTASLVAINPADGAVLALVGGKGFEQAKFNLATQGARQPGSSFKAIALAAALEAGYSTEDFVDATAPCVFPMPAGQEPWTVYNYDGDPGGGIVTLRDATVKSANCAYAQLSTHLGADKIADMARRVGVTSHMQAVPSVALGAVEASPLEMAAANATFAADGIYHPPIFIRRVVGPDDTVLLENNPTSTRAMAPETARLVTNVLSEVITRGTGQAASIGRPAAGKTGTSQEWRDAWFNGYTPYLATSVWMGHPAGQISMTDVGGINVTGGSYPSQIWAAFMSVASSAYPPDELPAPPAQRPDQQWIGMQPPAPPPSASVAPEPPRQREESGDRDRGRRGKDDD